MAPFLLTDLFGKWGAYAIYLAIGFAFGFVLEIAGFGNSRKLAAQFYLSEMTVLKVMFGAIVTAMVLIFWASGLGLLDYNLVWVNPTYLWPGIVGGLIMGVGFILGGFCPGTSLVAAATAKIDGILFVAGVLFGIFLFGETVQGYEQFWHSSYMGRYTLPEWLNLPTGVVVLLLVLMALAMFFGAEQMERIFGGRNLKAEPRLRYAGAAALVLGSVGLIFLGQPTTADRWTRMAPTKEAQLAAREVQIAPGELLATLQDHKLKPILIDVRSEAEYNLFHLAYAINRPLATLDQSIADFHFEPANAIFILMSNDEAAATEAWKLLSAEAVPNVYILEGGINGWLAQFDAGDLTPLAVTGDDVLRYGAPAALGARWGASNPDPRLYELPYTPKIKLDRKRAPTSGGCG